MFELNNFDSLQIGVASPEKIRSWSFGEVTKAETINYRTQKPEKDGLFCEKIFGPTKDWECHCGKYKRNRYKNVVCDKCGVEVTRAKVRRERMGHIELAAPVTHIWYFRGVPSKISIILDIPTKELENIIYYTKYIVVNPGNTNLEKHSTYELAELDELYRKFGYGNFKIAQGAEAIKILLAELDLNKESEMLKKAVLEATGPKKIKLVKRYEVVEAFRNSGNRPEWMVLNVIPVLPPELRPMVPLDGGRFAASDLNDLYRRVINRNNRLKKLYEIGAPEIIVRNEKRMLQEAVDSLIDNGRRGKAATGPSNRELKSLSAMLKGKQGRFRQNLLGKRVDYSGRSVIVVGPELKMYQCGLPKEMALELFKPFVMNRLVETNVSANIKNAKRVVEKATEIEVWDILEDVIKDHPVLLNRAPTLHRLGIQAFEPILVEGKAIKLHPLVCSAFNADFDGDQMAVHVPLSIEAQAEARFLMLATNNILKLSDGKPIVSPTQDMVIGSYYLTIIKEGAKGEGRAFRNVEEALMAYQLKEIELQALVQIRVTKVIDGVSYNKRVKTSVGRFIFNQAIPQDLKFVPRDTPEQMLDLEIDFLIDKKQLSNIVEACFKYKGATETSKVLDKIKEQGFKYSTIGAITTSVFDMHVPPNKKELIKNAEMKAVVVEKQFNHGLLNETDRYNQIIAIWQEANNTVNEEVFKNLGKFNPIWMMANSGARGNKNQVSQLCGMRGLIRDPSGRIVELPVKANYREGLSVLEYFISSHGGRKGLADTAIKTADSGYLTRRLVDVAQDVIINEYDCGDTKGFVVESIEPNIESLADRIDGRYCMEDLIHPTTGELLVPKDTMLNPDQAKLVDKSGIKSVKIRSVLECKSVVGICSKCYGKNMASGNSIKIGEAVGVIAAQSIGEPGTQLTMRTFHTGGVASSEDITQGLPRVEELFEARKPKGEAIISEIAGTVSVDKEHRIITVTPFIKENIEAQIKEYRYIFGQKVIIENGAAVQPGSMLTKGSINPHDMLKAKGLRGVQDYLLKEVQAAYGVNGVNINDKHTEVIVRQMLRKVKIEAQGDTKMIPGTYVDYFTYETENLNTVENSKRPATAKRALLGITKAALASDSFLSAASFQETSRILTEAAVQNKIDHLLGLKENVILGKVIPAGTGMKEYKNITTVLVDNGANDITENDEHIDKYFDEEDYEDEDYDDELDEEDAEDDIDSDEEELEDEDLEEELEELEDLDEESEDK